jgi:hypothetical protein
MYAFRTILTTKTIISLNTFDWVVFAMEMRYVVFEDLIKFEYYLEEFHALTNRNSKKNIYNSRKENLLLPWNILWTFIPLPLKRRHLKIFFFLSCNSFIFFSASFFYFAPSHLFSTSALKSFLSSKWQQFLYPSLPFIPFVSSSLPILCHTFLLHTFHFPVLSHFLSVFLSTPPLPIFYPIRTFLSYPSLSCIIFLFYSFSILSPFLSQFLLLLPSY